jgi:hypothetical protein
MVKVTLVVAVAIGILQLSCGSAANCQDPKNAQSAACVIEGAVVDCTGVSSLASAVAVVQPIVDKLLVSAVQLDGTIAWAGIEGQIISLALQYGTCVIAEIWNFYINGGPLPGSGSGSGSGSAVGSGSGSATPPPPTGLLAKAKVSSADFTAEFNRIRAQTAPGRSFKTRGGTL